MRSNLLPREQAMKKLLFRLMPGATVAVSLVSLMLGAFLQGCDALNQPEYPDPTTRALSDPMNYEPQMDSPDSTIGGQSNSLDKAGLQKDLNYVLNP
jgi:hypothetical protein